MYEKTEGGTYVEKKQLVVAGRFGYHSIQDDLLLYSTVEQLKKEGIEPIILSGNPDATSKQFHVKSLNRLDFSSLFEVIKQTDGLLLLEGTSFTQHASYKTYLYFLSILKLAQSFHKATFFYSHTLKKPKHTLTLPFFKHVMKKCTGRFAYQHEYPSFLLPFEKEGNLMFQFVPLGNFVLSFELEQFLQKKPVLLFADEREKEDIHTRIQVFTEQHVPVLILPSSFSYSSSYFEEIALKWNEHTLVHVQKESLTLEELGHVTSFLSLPEAERDYSLISMITDVFEVKKSE